MQYHVHEQNNISQYMLYGLPNKPVYSGELMPGHSASAEVVTDSLGPQIL